ncbi:endonuclease/exonuclease/phosphatase family protein [Chloroflexota bacterium]
MNFEKKAIRIMTYNIGGAQKDFDSHFNKIIKLIKNLSPDVLIVQEAIQWQDAAGICHSNVQTLADGLDFEYSFFGPTVSMQEHLTVRKSNFVDNIFNDITSWDYGNAILSKRAFTQFSDISKPGSPRNIPLFKPPLYHGSRDTDPRYAILGRINCNPLYPYLVGVHFTTLLGERTPSAFANAELSDSAQFSLKSKSEQGEIVRYQQAKRLIDLLNKHVLLQGKPVILAGDFNAKADEACLTAVIEQSGFVRLKPENPNSHTHIKVPRPVDHIFVSPQDLLADYTCQIIDDEIADQASDHRPVFAEITFK